VPLMNSFYKHHRDSIRWHYRCFDRILAALPSVASVTGLSACKISSLAPHSRPASKINALRSAGVSNFFRDIMILLSGNWSEERRLRNANDSGMKRACSRAKGTEARSRLRCCSMNLRCGTRTGQTQRDCCAQLVGRQPAGAPFRATAGVSGHRPR
jgi:hypothetical protein